MESQISDFMPLFWGIIGILGVTLSYKLAKFFIMAKSETKGALKMQISELKELAEHHKKEAQRWRGRFGNKEVKPTVENGDPADLETFIPNLIQQYGSLAPNWLKPFLNDPKMIKFLIDQAKQNPDAAKSILSNFVGKPKTNAETGQSENEPSAFTEYA